VLFDWFTILAQIVNFLVLVALMKRFLYGPLIAAIDAREKSIAARIAEAARKEQEAGARMEQLAKETAETEQKKGGRTRRGAGRCGPAARRDRRAGAREREGAGGQVARRTGTRKRSIPR
jgi:F-type H+-transporting ATPase subunit b